MTTRPLVLLLAALVLAICCLAAGTLRGSFRLWLAGYALAVLALVLAYVGVRAARRPSAPPPARVSASATAPTQSGARAAETARVSVGSAPAAHTRAALPGARP